MRSIADPATYVQNPFAADGLGCKQVSRGVLLIHFERKQRFAVIRLGDDTLSGEVQHTIRVMTIQQQSGMRRLSLNYCTLYRLWRKYPDK